MAKGRLAIGFWLIASLMAPTPVSARPRLPPPSTDAEQAQRDFVKACKSKSAEKLWPLFSERFRGQWEAEAERLRAALTPKDLRTAYRYKGEPKKFDGKAFLQGSLRRGVGENPCDDVKSWSIVTHALARSHHVFAMRRSDAYNFGLKFMNVDGHWYLDEITKVVAPASELPSPPADVPTDDGAPPPGDPGPVSRP